MLRPDEFALLTTALRPPAGHALDRAVGTTFTLDLVALMLSQLTFATHEMGTDVDRVAPIALMDAVARNAGATTVFVQGGGISVPVAYRPLLALLEDSIVEVTAPKGIFHPKVWALRYTDTEGSAHHRVLVLSRNLTFDRSWDTLLCLDEVAPESMAPTVSGESFADFVTWLPDLANRADAGRGVAELAASLTQARLAVPAPYTSAVVDVLGRGEPLDVGWRGSRGLLVSPFLTANVVREIAGPLDALAVVSTRMALDRLGEPPENTTLYTLSPAVDPDVEDIANSEDASAASRPSLRGLHAKVLVVDDGRSSWTFTGSANATGAGFGANVEMMVTLWGTRRETGVEAIWSGRSASDPGLEQLVVPYEPTPVDPEDRLREDLEWTLTHYLADLAARDTTTTVEALDGETYSLTVELPEWGPSSADGRSVAVTLRPLTNGEPKDAAPAVQWAPVSLAAVTPFVVATATVAERNVTVTSSCVLNTRLIGDPPGRRDQVLRDILKDRSDVTAYLAFLLGDPADDPGAETDMLLDRLGQAATGQAREQPPVVLFEPLVRAALGNSSALDRVASLVGQLERLGELDKLPEGFWELWRVALAAREAGR